MTNYEKYYIEFRELSINSSTEKSKEKTHVEKILTNLKPPNKPNTNLKDKIEFLKQASQYFITLAGIVIKENSVFISCTCPG